MNFEQAYILMRNGKKITRPGWQGYWYINAQTGRLTIHTKNGDEITNANNRDLIDLDLTVNQTLAEDWEIFLTEKEKKKKEMFDEVVNGVMNMNFFGKEKDGKEKVKNKIEGEEK